MKKSPAGSCHNPSSDSDAVLRASEVVAITRRLAYNRDTLSPSKKMEQIAVGVLLKGLYQTIVFTIELDQVPTALRTCVELVRTCYTDWCDLVELRNEYLALLESQPKILDRMNNIITNAHVSLQEVCVLVEKCRPVGGGSRPSLIRRLEWVLLDSTLFKQYEPVISRHHSSVLAELNFLRNLAFSSGTGGLQQEAEGGSDGDDKKPAKPKPTFENLDILGDIMGRSSSRSCIYC